MRLVMVVDQLDLLWSHQKNNKNIKFSNLKSPYIGPKFQTEEIENEIKK